MTRRPNRTRDAATLARHHATSIHYGQYSTTTKMICHDTAMFGIESKPHEPCGPRVLHSAREREHDRRGLWYYLRARQRFTKKERKRWPGISATPPPISPSSKAKETRTIISILHFFRTRATHTHQLRQNARSKLHPYCRH